MTRLIAYLRTIISPPPAYSAPLLVIYKKQYIESWNKEFVKSAELFTLSRFVGAGLVTARIYISSYSHSFCRCQRQARINLIEPPRYAGNDRRATTFFGHP